MAQIAHLRFMSSQKPGERGILLLHDDGTIQVQPSEALRDEMARLEEVALDRSRLFGTRLGLALIALGAAAVGAGWVVGRLFGKLGHDLSLPRSVDAVTLTHDAGRVQLTLPGANRFQTVQLAWNPDEVLQAEADTFMAKFAEMRRKPE